MSTILDKIKAYKLKEIAARKAARPLSQIEAAARDASPVRGFAAALDTKVAAGGYALIAEIKKASPSNCLLYTSPSPRDQRGPRMPSSA